MNPNHEKLLAEFLAENVAGEELLSACRADQCVLDELAGLTVVERLLKHQAQDTGAETFSAEVRAVLAGTNDAEAFARKVYAPLAADARSTPWIFRFPALAGLAAAALLVIALSYMFFASRPVAVLAESVAADWSGKPVSFGQGIRPGLVDLAAGYAELKFRNNVVVLIEGPCRLDIRSVDHVVLYRGELVANVPKEAIGFRVDTPSSEVVDLGTVFGVSVDQKGASEVHVLKGKVKARKTGSQSFVDLKENEARSFSNDEKLAKIIESAPDKFLRVLPGASERQPLYLHWSFDEGQGLLAKSDGNHGGATQYPASLKALAPSCELPQWSNGQFGGSLYFNGHSAYGTTAYPGIGENHPRTVAFWVKVPPPDSMRPVYGLVSWGSMAKVGSAWQISVNPTEKEGPLGRLRIGTREAQAVGTTDLRDNRWHHVAVVMYGGERVDVSTHILLYVDGRIEKTSKKSIHRIFTDVEGETSRTVMFGRDLGYPLDDVKVPAKLFKGWLDEVFIFEAALSREQVECLMRNNQVPTG